MTEYEVWKFELPIQDTVVLENIPEGFQPLHVGEQGDGFWSTSGELDGPAVSVEVER